MNKKCPNCGELNGEEGTVCWACGYSFDWIGSGEDTSYIG